MANCPTAPSTVVGWTRTARTGVSVTGHQGFAPRAIGRRFVTALLPWACLLLAAVAFATPALAASDAAALLAEADAALARDTPAAIELATRALAAAEQERNIDAHAEARFLLGRGQLQQGRLAGAIVHFEHGLALQPAQPRLRARLLTYLGATLDRAGLSVDAVAPQQEALRLYLEQRNWQDASAVLVNLGNAYSGMDDAEAARAHYERGLALKREHGITRGVGSVLNNLADFAGQRGHFGEAETLLRDAVAASREPDDAPARSVALANLGIALAEQGRFDEAMVAADEAAGLANSLQDRSRALGAQRARALVLLRRAAAATPASSARALSLREAADILRAAIDTAHDGDDSQRRMQLAALLADVREAQGDTGSALALLREVDDLREAGEAGRQSSRREAAAARFEYAKQSGELELLRQRDLAVGEQIRQQRWLVLALSLAVLAATAAALVAWHRIRERQRFEATLEQRHRDLAAALDEANAQRRRSDAYAASHRHLLHLASEDLRQPLNDIRADAERLLAAPGSAEEQQRRGASIARAASDLIWVTDQMLEGAREPDFAAPLEPRAPQPLRQLLQDLVDEAAVHALRHQIELVLDAPADTDAAVDPQRLRSVLGELLEQVLRACPAHNRCCVRLRADAQVARIAIDDIGGAAAGWQQRMDGDERSRTPRLGFAWIAQAIGALGGDIGTALHGTPPVRAVVVLLPRTPGVRLAED